MKPHKVKVTSTFEYTVHVMAENAEDALSIVGSGFGTKAGRPADANDGRIIKWDYCTSPVSETHEYLKQIK